jgi:benzil reductase ((S)-benzoin forming)
MSRRTVERAHPAYTHIPVDLADTGAVATAADTIVASRLHGRPWSRIGLVNNAAYGGRLGPLELVTPEDLARTHLVNVVAPTWLMGFFIRTIPADVPLRIVNVSSGAAVRPVHGLGPYCSSKAALRMAGMVLGAEIESPLRRTPVPRDTAILSYEPGVVETPMQQAARDAPADDFPWVGMFLDFKARGIVVAPERPAAEIVSFLESPPGAAFTERRLEG